MGQGQAQARHERERGARHPSLNLRQRPTALPASRPPGCDQQATLCIVRGGLRCWKPPSGARLQLVTNLSRLRCSSCKQAASRAGVGSDAAATVTAIVRCCCKLH